MALPLIMYQILSRDRREGVFEVKAFAKKYNCARRTSDTCHSYNSKTIANFGFVLNTFSNLLQSNCGSWLENVSAAEEKPHKHQEKIVSSLLELYVEPKINLSAYFSSTVVNSKGYFF